MTREDIRRENARVLAEQIGGLAAFARATEMTNSQVSQLIGKRPIKNIGPAIAPRIEDAFGKERGWLDVRHGDGEIDDDEIAELVRLYKSLGPHGKVTVMTVAKSLSGTSEQELP